METTPRRRAIDTFFYRKVPIIITSFLALAVLVTIVIFLFWSFHDYKTVEIKEPIKILTPHVRVGDTVVYDFVYDKYTDKFATVTRTMVCQDFDGTELQMPLLGFRGSFTKGFNQKARNGNIIVPPLTPPKDCYLKLIFIYQVNPIRDVQKIFITQHFEVLTELTPEQIKANTTIQSFTPRGPSEQQSPDVTPEPTCKVRILSLCIK